MSQIKNKFIENNAVTSEKILLENDAALRARNAADDADVDLIKLNASDEVVITGLTAPLEATDAATKDYVDTAVSNIDLSPYIEKPAGPSDGDYLRYNSVSGEWEAQSGPDASEVPYDNSVSGLVASNVQDAVDEVVSSLGNVDDAVNDLIALSGVPAGSQDLGSFTGSTIPDGSTVKEALQALETDLESIPDPLYYAGTYDASTNTPALSNTDTGVSGAVYQVTVAGTQDFGAGPISFEVGDKVVNNGTVWEKWDQTDAVNSVNGQTGVVELDASDIPYDNTVSGLTATDVQAAIDEVASDVASIDGANRTLSNLTSPTSVNQDLIPAGSQSLGSNGYPWGTVWVSNQVRMSKIRLQDAASFPSGITSTPALKGDDSKTNAIGMFTTSSISESTGAIHIETGNSSSGNSGDINLRTGTATGVRGSVNVVASKLDLGSSPIVNVADPTDPQDAATKAYVDSVASAAPSYRKEQIQLSSGQIAAKAVTLTETPVDGSVMLFAGGLCQLEDIDFEVVGDQINFLTPLSSVLAEGDYVVITYMHE